MGYVAMLATCVACKQRFMCNPALVPSVRVNGQKEPICRACIEKANPQRVANGLEPVRILPGAYEAEEVG